jgi:hypothetical protein
MLSRIILAAIAALLLAVPARAQPLPWPQITFRDQTRNFVTPGVKIYLNFQNGTDYDPALFEDVPSLPSCDDREPASRTWIEVREYGSGALLRRLCHFDWTGHHWIDPFWFTYHRPDPVTATLVYVVLWDRVTNRRSPSGPVGVPPPHRWF